MKIQSYQKKLNRREAQELHKEKIKKVLQGEGLYIYRNRTTGELRLSKPAQCVHLESGTKWHDNSVVPPKATFEGDNYFMSMIPREVSLVKTLVTPQQEKEQKMLQEQKLILDQPDKITHAGKVEHVVTSPLQSLNESPDEESNDVLLTEDPMEGVKILRD